MDLTSLSPAPPASRSAAEARLRRMSLSSLFALLIQYGLGMGVNLFVNVPDADQGKGTGSAVGKALSNGPAALSVHAGIGLLLILNVISVLVYAIRTRMTSMIVSAAVGFLCVVGAAMSGAAFVDKGANGASMTMAVLTGVAIATYGINLYVLGGRREV
ncbi:MAG TPA: hypothetical protein VFN97_07330 [Actinospica sp.]|nr:hypothetical protein [Actinospica sp.]